MIINDTVLSSMGLEEIQRIFESFHNLQSSQLLLLQTLSDKLSYRSPPWV